MNPFKPDNHTQILKTDLHAFPSRSSREDSIEEESIFPLVTMFYLFSQFYLLMMSCCCPEKINMCIFGYLFFFFFIILVWGPPVIQLKYCPVLPSLNKVDYYCYNVGPLLRLEGLRDLSNLPSPNWRLSLPAQVRKIPRSWKWLSGKRLDIAEDESTPIMTSSIVPLNICRITEKLYITCKQLAFPG